MTAPPAIGINLGASASCVAVYQNGNYTVIENEEGKLATPPFVAFAEEQLIGEEAKSCLKVDGKNVVFNMKQMIGRQFNDRFLQQKMVEWPFEVINGIEGNPTIQVQSRNQKLSLTPQQVTLEFLSMIKHLAMKHCEQRLSNVVISIPSFFNTHQRQSTMNAASIFGPENVNLIHNTTAIALSYFKRLSERKVTTPQNVLIFDLGATSFEVSVVAFTSNSLQVMSTVGTCEFGGNDFDERLVRYFTTKFEKHNKCDTQLNKNAMQRLRCYCEEAKIQLSKRTAAPIRIDNFWSGLDFNETVTRKQFEAICGDLFHRITVFVQKALSDANVDKDSVNEVVVVGGASKMPKIQQILEETFGNKLNKSLNAIGDCIAIGAAIQASILNKSNKEFNSLKIKNIIPYSLGIETNGGVMSRIINRNTRIECRHKKCFTTSDNNQKQLKVKVFEGEAVLTKYNRLIGVFTFDGISQALKGEPEVELFFEVDANGILNIYGSERLKSKQKQERIVDNVEITTSECEMFGKEQERRLAKNNLEKAMLNAERLLTSFTKAKKGEVKSWIKVVRKWLTDNQFASKEELDKKKQQIEYLIGT